MAVTDKKAHRFALHAKHRIRCTAATVAINQAGVTYDACIPFPVGLKFPGQAAYLVIESVQVFCRATAATATVDIKKGATSVLTGGIVPVAATVVEGALVALLATKLFAPGDQLNLVITTNGTGTITDLAVHIVMRPYPMSEEAA